MEKEKINLWKSKAHPIFWKWQFRIENILLSIVLVSIIIFLGFLIVIFSFKMA